MNFGITVKITLWKEVKKMLNAKLERYMVRPCALSHEVSTFIYIYIYIEPQVFYFGNSETVHFI